MQPVEVRPRTAPGTRTVRVVNPSVPKRVDVFNTSPLFCQRPDRRYGRRSLERLSCQANVGAGRGHGRPPLTAIAGRLDFSECVLHGLFVDELMGTQATSFVSDDPLCRAYWEPVPLNADSAAHFIRAVRPTDVAVAISSKSHTPLAVRDAIFSALRTA